VCRGKGCKDFHEPCVCQGLPGHDGWCWRWVRLHRLSLHCWYVEGILEREVREREGEKSPPALSSPLSLSPSLPLFLSPPSRPLALSPALPPTLLHTHSLSPSHPHPRTDSYVAPSKSEDTCAAPEHVFPIDVAPLTTSCVNGISVLALRLDWADGGLEGERDPAPGGDSERDGQGEGGKPGSVYGGGASGGGGEGDACREVLLYAGAHMSAWQVCGVCLVLRVRVLFLSRRHVLSAEQALLHSRVPYCILFVWIYV